MSYFHNFSFSKKQVVSGIFIALSFSLSFDRNLQFTQFAFAEGSSTGFSELALKNAKHPNMTLWAPPEPLKKGEYIIVDTVGGTTRSLCPYTCEDRGLPKEHCKAWPAVSSTNKSVGPYTTGVMLPAPECYLRDTRIKSGAFKKE